MDVSMPKSEPDTTKVVTSIWRSWVACAAMAAPSDLELGHALFELLG
jgi:hypothetical protein